MAMVMVGGVGRSGGFGGSRGEMNLGKMGIQICEKLREGLGWRQIGSCHKWDRGAGAAGGWGDCATEGPRLHTSSSQSVNQDPAKTRRGGWERLTSSLLPPSTSTPRHLMTPNQLHYLSRVASRQRVPLQPTRLRLSALWNRCGFGAVRKKKKTSHRAQLMHRFFFSLPINTSRYMYFILGVKKASLASSD